jgi:Terminase large subunit, T4likevirus-type, N-terminal
MTDKVWKPHKRQETFAEIPDVVFEALYGGAAGGGKSELLLMLPIVRGFYKEPRFKGLLLRRTFPELEAEIIVRSREWYPLTGAKYNEDKKRWTFPSGAIMQFGHAEYESDVRKYDSSEYNYVAFDELTSFTKFQYIYITRTRCRSSSSRLPAIARAGTNPGNVGHAWVRDHFIDIAPYGTIAIVKVKRDDGSIIYDADGNTVTNKRIFIQSFAEDNPYLMENDPQYINRLESLPEAERRAKREGAWDTFEGQVFSDYREVADIASGEPPNACHLVEPFPIPDWWLKFLAIDWGYSAMTIALWGALSPDDRLYIYREYAIKEAKTSTWATEIGQLSTGEKYTDIVLCRSAWQTRGDELTQQEAFTKYSGLIARQADNNRISGKLTLQEYLRWKVRPPRTPISQVEYSHETAAKILRVQGQEAYQSYLASFEPVVEKEILPKLQIFPDCKEFRKCLPLCIYDKKSNTTNKPAEDVREFDGDDPYDAGRYLVRSVDNYLGSLKNEGARRNKINQVVEQFQRDQNWTEFYRKMERAESFHSRIQPIRRYHRAG